MKEYYSMSPEESRVNAKASQFRNREKGYTLHMDEKEIVYESKENTGEVSIRTIEDLDVALPSLCETVYGTRYTSVSVHTHEVLFLTCNMTSFPRIFQMLLVLRIWRQHTKGHWLLS